MGAATDAISGTPIEVREGRSGGDRGPGGGMTGDWIVDVVERMGGHPCRALDIDLARDAGAAERWLVVCCLLSGRAAEAVALAAARALEAAGLAEPAALAAAEPSVVAKLLRGTQYPDAEKSAVRLVRIAGGVARSPSLSALAREAEGSQDLAARIAALAPGLGPATVTRFLQPLRDVWPMAAEIPLGPAARAAAVHLGVLREGEDEEGEPAALRAALRERPAAPSLCDVEAALARLGRLACLRGRTRRCPLGQACPARDREAEAGSGAL